MLPVVTHAVELLELLPPLGTFEFQGQVGALPLLVSLIHARGSSLLGGQLGRQSLVSITQGAPARR